MTLTLGQIIRKFRNRAGLSQLDLECKIGAASGSVSRIESGRVNPTKETMVDIAKALHLSTSEIASLFGIDIRDTTQLFQEATTILASNELNEVLDRTVNDLIFKMGYLASCIFLVDGEDVYLRAVTNSNISKKIFKYIPVSPYSLSVSVKKHANNLTIRSIIDNKVFVTPHTRDYVVPAVPTLLANKLQQMTGDKSNIIFPLCTNGKAFGTIVFIKKVESDFSGEKEYLGVLANQIAIAIENAQLKTELGEFKNALRKKVV